MSYNGDMNGDSEDDVCSKESTPLKGSRKSARLSLSDHSNHLHERGRPRIRKVKEQCTSFVAIAAAVSALLLCIVLLFADAIRGWHDPVDPKDTDEKRLQQYDEYGRYIVEDYDATPAFSDFLPGLAGIYGKPLYAFYTNRGQGIASFGIQSKDYPILEFQPANKAYQTTALVGFRTFIQGSRGTQKFFTEPFGALTTRFPDAMADFSVTASNLMSSFYSPKRFMYIGPNEMQIREVDSTHSIETNVTFFILPEEDFGAFVRRTTIQNTARKGKPLKLSVLDGLARIEPAGGKLDGFLKDMGKTLEGFMNVYSPYEGSQDMPFFRVTSQPSDTEATTAQVAGHYCLSMIDGDPSKLLPIIHDPSKVFGDDTSMMRPIRLLSRNLADILAESQYGAAKTPSAFAAADAIVLNPGETITITSFYGKTSSILDVPVIARRVLQPGFGQYKESRVREIVKQITAQIDTKTSNELFNGYIKQMFLDSSLNGGVPTILGEVDDDAMLRNADEDMRLKVYHLFSRIHGDLERDYNDFKVNPTFFSEGPGRFNDLAQHRRNDVFFAPRVGSFNVKTFLSFLQADGYNPLTIESVSFTINDRSACDEIAASAVGPADGHRAQRESLSSILNGGPFRPGQLFELMEEAHIELVIPIHNFIDMVLASADMHPMGMYGSGFWADHWTYFMDFVEAYLAIYPDQEQKFLFDEKLKYFFSPESVQPRCRKYVSSLRFDGNGHHIRQLGAVYHDRDKVNYRNSYFDIKTGQYSLEANWMHDSNADVFESTPMEKLVLLATLKFATRDPYGIGIEYEAGKPGYNTALNGLPSMLGSGVSEAHELLRLLRYLLSVVMKFRRSIHVPAELYSLMICIEESLGNLRKEKFSEANDITVKVPQYRFEYWDRVATAREVYREKVRVFFDGDTVKVDYEYMSSTLKSWIEEVEDGLVRAMMFGTSGEGNDGTSGLSPSYFSYNVTKWKKTGELNPDGHSFVNATQMVINRFPLFLEGPTRMMQTSTVQEAKEIYTKISQSPLRDDELGMYTFSASLKGQSLDIGRAMAFAPGWLENQSVWIEMSYRLYKQLLQNNLIEEFFHEMQSGGMLPFMHPDKYGRSLMECSAFVASSVFEDPAKHGRGFYARITGATSEFLMMWVQMMIGKKPFSVNETTGQLQMQLLPALPQWLFMEGSNFRGISSDVPMIGFKLFGSIDVRYFNEGGGDLFQVPPYRYVVGYRDGSTFEVNGSVIPFGLADKIRKVVFVATIDVYFH